MGKGSHRRIENAAAVRERWPLSTRLPGGDKLLTAKQIAEELGRHVNYIYAMKRRGFMMPGGVSTVNLALEWLENNPPPRCKNA